MKIVAIGLSHNEADVIGECVRDALAWVDAFVLYDSSTDGTAEIARETGAVVLPGDPDESFDEGLRQHTLAYAAGLNPDWIVRIDPDEFYPRGVCFAGLLPQDPRAIFKAAEQSGYAALRAQVVQFWITVDDVRRGLLLEDEQVSVQKRRRWYTVGHSATVGWRHDPRLTYRMGQKENVPFSPNGVVVGAQGMEHSLLIQTHYPCRSLAQLVARVAHRKRFGASFGKYRHNLIIDEQVAGLHYWDGGAFSRAINHPALYSWYEMADQLFSERLKQ